MQEGLHPTNFEELLSQRVLDIYKRSKVAMGDTSQVKITVASMQMIKVGNG